MATRFHYESIPTRRESIRAAKRLYKILFGEDLPKGWRISFGDIGSCDHHCKEISVAAQDVHDGLRTLIHEFIHQRNPDLAHGKKFAHLERDCFRRVFRV